MTERPAEAEPFVAAAAGPTPRLVRIGRWIGRKGDRFGPAQVPIGIAAALAAVAVRSALPLSPTQLPTITVVVAVALTSTFIGLTAGILTALLGGILSWYLFFTPHSWALTHGDAVLLLGFFIIASVIIATSTVYRLSEQRNHQAQLAAMKKEAEAAELFAREVAHRLKNALAIVQSIAIQTLGDDTAKTEKFAARLKALADAHDLLAAHVHRPTAEVADLVEATLSPFAGSRRRIQVGYSDARLAASQSVSLALAVHELATNASKYGALSNPGGSVSLRVEDAGDGVRLVWKEQGGPPVREPASEGFGMTLLRRLDRQAELRYEPDGLRCSLFLRKA